MKGIIRSINKILFMVLAIVSFLSFAKIIDRISNNAHAEIQSDISANVIRKLNLQNKVSNYHYYNEDASEVVVSLDPNYGLCLTQNIVVEYNSEYGELPTPERSGYVFLGWFDQLEDGNEITSSTVCGVNENHTLYAHWQAKSYVLSFDSNGGSELRSIRLDVGDRLDQVLSPTKQGYIFRGWYFDDDTFLNAFDINSFAMPDGNVTLHAKWSKSIIYLNGGEDHYDFLVLSEREDVYEYDGEYFADYIYYRETYTKNNIAHGQEVDNYAILGDIRYGTSINEFLSHLDVNRSDIRIYDAEGILIYDQGYATPALLDLGEDCLDDGEICPVGTSFKVELFINGEVLDTIILSVLGDFDSTGTLTANDYNYLRNWIMHDTVNEQPLEVVLAAYIRNDGIYDKITQSDEYAELKSITKGISGHRIEYYFTYNQADSTFALNSVESGTESEILSYELPQGYTGIPYIQTSGSEYIDTQYVPNQDTTVDITFDFVAKRGANSAIVGARHDVTLDAYTIVSGGGKGSTITKFYRTAYFGYNKDNTYSSFILEDNVKYNIIKKANDCYINGKLIQTKEKGNFTSPYTMTIFGVQQDSEEGSVVSFCTIGRLYSFAIYQNDNVVSYMIPCSRNGDGELGMYDTIRNIFFTNSGSGKFTTNVQKIPSEYQEIEYIESSGTQYLSLDYTAEEDDIIDSQFEFTTTRIRNCIIGSSISGTRVLAARLGTQNSRWFYGLYYHRSYQPENEAYQGLENQVNNRKYSVRLQSHTVTIDGVSYPLNTDDLSTNVSNKMFIFKDNYGTTVETYKYGYARMYKLSIIRNDEVINNLVPCIRISDGVAGMYDTITGVFLTNKGTGKFNTPNSVSSEYQQVEYIETTREQYIKLDYIANSKTTVKMDMQLFGDRRYIEGGYNIIGKARTTTNYEGGLFTLNFGASSTQDNDLYFWLHSYNSVSSRISSIKNAALIKSRCTITESAYTRTASIETSTQKLSMKINTALKDDNNFEMCLLGGAGNDSTLGPLKAYQARLWGTKIYEADDLIINLIPCFRKVDGVAGLYDTVNLKFYPSTSGVDFVIPTRLPDEYQEVEYIEANGEQSIEIPYTVTASTKVVTNYMYTETLNRNMIIGINGDSQIPAGSQRVGVRLGYTTSGGVNGLAGCYYERTYPISSMRRENNVIYKATLTSTKLTIDGQSWTLTKTVHDNKVQCNLVLFKDTVTYESYSCCRLYKLEVYEGTRLTLNLIPCFRKADGEVGLYDLVSGTFYYSDTGVNLLSGLYVY